MPAALTAAIPHMAQRVEKRATCGGIWWKRGKTGQRAKDMGSWRPHSKWKQKDFGLVN